MTGQLVVDRQESLLGGATATFSPCRTWRYELTRQWDPELPVTVWIMCNPSTADAFALDPTVRRCVNFTRYWRPASGGIVVCNLFGLRSTDPQALTAHPDPVGPCNDDAIVDVLTWTRVRRVVCGWGVHGTLHGRGQRVLSMVTELGVDPLCLGVTKGGYPRHPLYVPADAELVPFAGVA